MIKFKSKKFLHKLFCGVLAVVAFILVAIMTYYKFSLKSIAKNIGFSDSVILSYINGKKIPKYNLKDTLSDAKISDVTTQKYDCDMCVHFIDVGKADCAYIKCKDVNILIDAADKEPDNVVTEYLKRQNVEKLDLVAVSHPHRDHIGQMKDVINNFKIDRFIESDIPDEQVPTTWTYENMLKALINKNIVSEVVHAGDKFEIGDLTINILGPVIKNKKDINENSLVMKITYKDVSFLFMGDAGRSEEKDILENISLNNNLKNNDLNQNHGEPDRKNKKNSDIKNNMLHSTVLKVGHHGSNNSSTTTFLNKVNPDYAVISVGEERGYLTQCRAVNRIKKVCNNIYRTDESGTIIMLTDGKNIDVKTEK